MSWKAMTTALALGCSVAALCSVGADGPGERREKADRAGAAPAKMERTAYLGVATSPADPTLSRQLGLPRGVGLTVDYIDPQSPASTSLEPHDVLHKLNDQLLVTHEQLAVLVRMQQPGAKVRLAVLRGGKSVELNVELGEKELPVLEPRRWGLPDVQLHPPVFQPFRIPPSGPDIESDMDRRMQEQTERIEDALQAMRDLALRRRGCDPAQGRGPNSCPTPCRPTPGVAPGQPGSICDMDAPPVIGQCTACIVEDGLTVTLTTDPAGHRHVRATDSDGKLVFEGPMDTDEQFQKAPDKVKARIEKLNAMRGNMAPHAPELPGQGRIY